MTVASNKTGKVVLNCEGIRATGDMCDNTVDVALPGKDPETKMPYTKAKRVTLARKQVQEKGWRVTKSADECPKVHGAVPVPLKAKERVEPGAPPCPGNTQPGHDRAGAVVADGKIFAVCGAPSCRAATLGFAYKTTGVQGEYVSDTKAAA